MKTSMARLLMFAVGIICATGLSSAHADDETATPQATKPQAAATTAGQGATEAAAADVQNNPAAKPPENTVATEAQALVASQCVDGHCYKSAKLGDSCDDTGEVAAGGCMHPPSATSAAEEAHTGSSAIKK